jgi:UDP-N-acetylmuramyl pentapeptide phosphotransferase/UDP-N-acetylglucosamine-1-phosphate transferase
MSAAGEAWRAVAWLAPMVAAAAAAISAGLILALRPWLARSALASPNARSSHREPTPQWGGAAVVAATVTIVLAVAPFAPQFGSAWPQGTVATLAPVLAATLALAVVGAADDQRGLPVRVRLGLQVVAVAAVILALPAELRVVADLPLALERALLILGGVGFVNIVNFMDGIDWITVAEVVPVAGGLVLIGALGALPAPGVLVAAAVLGAVIGFAPFNRPVARLFLGDVGSLPLGLLLGWLLVLLAGSGHLFAALLLPLYYLADGTLTLLRRLVAREPVWQAHRTHFYQRATDRGWSVIEIDTRIFVVNLGLVALAATTVLASSRIVDLSAFGLGCFLVAGLLVSLARGKP